MSCDIDDVVGAAHDVEIAIFIHVARIGGFIIAGKFVEIGFAKSLIGVPQGRQTTGRQWQLDEDISKLATFDFMARIVEHADVIAGQTDGRRAVFGFKQSKAKRIGDHRPAAFGLPPMIDHRTTEQIFRPVDRVGIGTFARQIKRAEF